MKTKLLCLITIIFSFPKIASSQNSDWLKDDRNNVYNDCMSNTTKYKSATEEQRQSVCLCYMDEITKKFSKSEYNSKIDIEIKRIRESTISQCSKNTGVTLTEDLPMPEKVVQSEVSENIATKENLVGHWKESDGEFWLFETGDFKMTKFVGTTSKGTWKLNEQTLTLYNEKRFGTVQDYKILMFSKDKFVYQSVNNRKNTNTVERVK
jgi:hypothetical protein